MNVWVRRTKRRSTCSYCQGEITNGSYQVVCQHYVKTSGGKNWWFRRSFHPQCWIDQAIAELEKIPVVETRGKKRMQLTDDDRAKRRSIILRRGSVIQRIKKEMAKPEEDRDVDKIIRLGAMLEKLKEEIRYYGGVPKSWE